VSSVIGFATVDLYLQYIDVKDNGACKIARN